MISLEPSWSQATDETFILDKDFNTIPAPDDCHTKHSWQQVGFVDPKRLKNKNQSSILYYLSSSTLWDKLEEIAPESWDDFSDLFSRQVVVAKPVKPKAESKPMKQQTVKSE